MTSGPSAPDPIYTLRGVADTVTALKFQADESLYSGSGNGTVHTWNMKTRRISSTLVAHPGHSVLWIDFTSSGGELWTHGRDGWVKQWSQSDTGWKETAKLKTSALGFCAACLLPEKNLLAAPGEKQSQVDLYDITSQKLVSHLYVEPGDKPFGMCMKIKASHSTDACNVVVGYEDGSVALWDLRNMKLIDRNIVHEESVMCMDVNSQTLKGFSGSANETLISWDIKDDKIQTSNKVTVKNPGFNDVVSRADGKIVVTAGWDSRIRIFGCKKFKPLAILSYHKESVNCVAFASNNILACGSKDQHISLWDIYR